MVDSTSFRAGIDAACVGRMFKLGSPTPTGTDLINLGSGKKITANISKRDDRVSVKFTGPLEDYDRIVRRYESRPDLIVGEVTNQRHEKKTESQLQVERPYSEWIANPTAIYAWVRETALVFAALAIP